MTLSKEHQLKVKINDDLIHRYYDVLDNETIINLKDFIKSNVFYEAYPIFNDSLVSKFYETESYKKILDTVKDTVKTITNKPVELKASWLVNQNGLSGKYVDKNTFHVHKDEYTCVYYLQNQCREFGTRLENGIVLEGTENSMVVFSGKISHSVPYVPVELLKKNPRITIVFDF